MSNPIDGPGIYKMRNGELIALSRDKDFPLYLSQGHGFLYCDTSVERGNMVQPFSGVSHSQDIVAKVVQS